MRRFIFTAKNIGRERYLTYVMGEGMEVDEDVLDYCEDNDIPEILNIIYEEDDDYDYLTYDVTGRTTLETFTQDTMTREKVFTILRNISLSMINVKEHAIPLSYILLNKGFMYIDPDTLDIKFLYLPVEGDASVSTEFKSFVRQLMAGMKYDVDEDVSYVGQLLTYVNGDSFNLRGLIGLTEAMMQDAGMTYSEEEGISTEDGAEVVESASPEVDDDHEKGAMDFMKDLDSADDKMPEIGDDEEDDIELEDAAETEVLSDPETEILAEAEPEAEAEAEAEEPVEEAAEEAAEEVAEEEAEEATEEAAEEAEPEEEPAPEPEPIEETRSVEREVEHTETLEDIKAKLQELAGAVDGKKPPKPPKKDPAAKPVRVSRAAMLKAAEEAIEEEDAAAAEAEEVAEAEEKLEKESKKKSSKKDADKKDAEKKEDEKKEPEKKEAKGKTEVIDNTILGSTGAIKINPYLIRVNTKDRIMINKPVFKIGKATRGVDYRVSGNGAISRQHAVIVHKGDSYYIKDNKSTNHTYVNETELADDEEVLLTDNCKIRLGDEEFTFRLG